MVYKLKRSWVSADGTHGYRKRIFFKEVEIQVLFGLGKKRGVMRGGMRRFRGERGVMCLWNALPYNGKRMLRKYLHKPAPRAKKKKEKKTPSVSGSDSESSISGFSDSSSGGSLSTSFNSEPDSGDSDIDFGLQIRAGGSWALADPGPIWSYRPSGSLGFPRAAP
jgi:hypothetical protein